jgi:hypothetical protein
VLRQPAAARISRLLRSSIPTIGPEWLDMTLPA